MACFSIERKQCLLCGSAQTTKFNFSSNLSPEDEVCRLYHQLHDLEIVSDVISVQRIYILRRSNASRALTANLPYELLYAIFEHACLLSRLDSNDESNNSEQRGSDHFQVVLAGVSSRWRAIVLSSPLLWTRLSLHFCEHGGRQLANRLALLRLYLTYSGSTPLDLRFTFSHIPSRQPWPGFDALIHPIIDNILLANLHRIRDLYLEKASPKWIACTPQLSQLMTFRYSSNAAPYNGTPIISFSNPQHLCKLSIFNWPSVDIKSGVWTGLSTLTLESMEVNVCVSLLAECINLKEFRCRTPKTLVISSWFPYQPWRTRVTREHLEVFEWDMPRSGQLGQVEIAMLQYVHLPTVRFLRLHTYHHCRHHAVRSFCKRLPSTLSTLNLSIICDDTELQNHCLFDFIPRDCLVEDLTLYCNGCATFVGHAFSWLEDPKYFPQLKRLIIDDTAEDCGRSRMVSPSWHGQMIYRMLASRAPFLRPSGFYMRFASITVAWPWHTKHEIWTLGQNHGFQLIIEEDKAPLDQPRPLVLFS